MLAITPKLVKCLTRSPSRPTKQIVLRVEIVGRGPKGFQYDLQFVGAEGGSEDDYINEVDGITVRIALGVFNISTVRLLTSRRP